MLDVSQEQTDLINGSAYKDYIKILYLPAELQAEGGFCLL
jgi:hypothetical protein